MEIKTKDEVFQEMIDFIFEYVKVTRSAVPFHPVTLKDRQMFNRSQQLLAAAAKVLAAEAKK